MVETETHPDVEQLIEECERHGANVDKQRVHSDYNLFVTDLEMSHMEALRTTEHEISNRCGLPHSIKFGKVSPRGAPTQQFQQDSNATATV